jgi:hypothetical protein
MKEAEREESFISNNLGDSVHMSELTKEALESYEKLREARKNDREIRSNVPKLIKILMKNDAQRMKFEKEFATQIKNSDLKNFALQFEDLRKLYNIHLTTSKEEVDSVKRQTMELEIKTNELASIVKNKEEELTKRQDS